MPEYLPRDLTAQWDALLALGVSADRTDVDHGVTGTNRERPQLLQAALAACKKRLQHSNGERSAGCTAHIAVHRDSP